MKEFIEPLADLPGVDLALLFGPDGVPITFARPTGRSTRLPRVDGQAASVSREEAVSALAGGWANELAMATAPLTWGPPQRVVLRCARGTLVMRRLRGAVLAVLLARGVAPEDVRLPMDGATARIERGLRTRASRPRPEEEEPPGPIPSQNDVRPDPELAETSDTPLTEELSQD